MNFSLKSAPKIKAVRLGVSKLTVSFLSLCFFTPALVGAVTVNVSGILTGGDSSATPTVGIPTTWSLTIPLSPDGYYTRDPGMLGSSWLLTSAQPGFFTVFGATYATYEVDTNFMLTGGDDPKLGLLSETWDTIGNLSLHFALRLEWGMMGTAPVPDDLLTALPALPDLSLATTKTLFASIKDPVTQQYSLYGQGPITSFYVSIPEPTPFGLVLLGCGLSFSLKRARK